MYVLDQKLENKVYPLKPQFFYIKVGFEGVYIARTCFPDGLETLEIYIPQTQAMLCNENNITKTCPCNIQRFFSAFKFENFNGKTLMFLIFSLEAVLTSTHNLCFGAKIRKLDIPLHTPVLLYKSGVQGGIHCTDVLS